MKATLLVLATILAIAFATIENDFSNFQKKYGKSYKTQAEFNLRFNNFKSNAAKAAELTKLNGGSATFGINKFSDLSEEEFRTNYLMSDFDGEILKQYPVKTDFTSGPVNDNCNPDSTNFDWTTCGVVTPIRNQGQCGSCWAFSATETLESYYAISGGPLTLLSVEQIVDCDTNGNDNGCNGGFPSGAYSYIQSAGGLESESSYPYSAGGGESGSCQIGNGTKPTFVATVTGSNSINGETGLYQQTSSSSGGPVSICVDASSWQTYTGGVLTSCGTSVDHCVQLVGYSNYGQSGAYWIVRNSWGEDWGETGHIWVAIGQDLCSIGDYATIVTASSA